MTCIFRLSWIQRWVSKYRGAHWWPGERMYQSAIKFPLEAPMQLAHKWTRVKARIERQVIVAHHGYGTFVYARWSLLRRPFYCPRSPLQLSFSVPQATPRRSLYNGRDVCCVIEKQISRPLKSHMHRSIVFVSSLVKWVTTIHKFCGRVHITSLSE